MYRTINRKQLESKWSGKEISFEAVTKENSQRWSWGNVGRQTVLEAASIQPPKASTVLIASENNDDENSDCLGRFHCIFPDRVHVIAEADVCPEQSFATSVLSIVIGTKRMWPPISCTDRQLVSAARNTAPPQTTALGFLTRQPTVSKQLIISRPANGTRLSGHQYTVKKVKSCHL